jgi:hypothetical protein
MKRSEAIAAVEASVKAAQEAGVSFIELQEAVGWGAFQGGSIENRDLIEEHLDQRDHECENQCPDETDHLRVDELENALEPLAYHYGLSREARAETIVDMALKDLEDLSEIVEAASSVIARRDREGTKDNPEPKESTAR